MSRHAQQTIGEHRRAVHPDEMTCSRCAEARDLLLELRRAVRQHALDAERLGVLLGALDRSPSPPPTREDHPRT
jgi:hypothetical protein